MTDRKEAAQCSQGVVLAQLSGFPYGLGIHRHT